MDVNSNITTTSDDTMPLEDAQKLENLYELPYKNYALLGLLGEGAFAKVWYAKDKANNTDVAIKIIELESNTASTWEEIRRETSIMHSLQHKNIVACLASFVVAEELWLVMPLLSGGSCSHVMRNHCECKDGIKDESLLATILRDVLEGLVYFHNSGRIHRDIKAGNILLSSDGVAKIADFGVSGALIENGYKKRNRRTFTGTPCWMAPEVMESKPHNTKADIWSFGITALELAFAKPPYADERPMKVMLLIMQQAPPDATVYKDSNSKDVFSKEFHKLVKSCLKKNPAKRPAAKDLLKESWFKRAKDPNYVRNRILYSLPPKQVKPVSKTGLPRSLLAPEAPGDRVTQSKLSFDFRDTPITQSLSESQREWFIKLKLGIVDEEGYPAEGREEKEQIGTGGDNQDQVNAESNKKDVVIENKTPDNNTPTPAQTSLEEDDKTTTSERAPTPKTTGEPPVEPAVEQRPDGLPPSGEDDAEATQRPSVAVIDVPSDMQ